MHRRINNRKIPRVAHSFTHDGVDICLVDLGTNHHDRAIDDPRLERLFGDLLFRDLLDTGDDPGVVGRDHLATGRRVAFEAVVGGRVVRGGDHDAGVAAKVANCKRKQGGGARFPKKVNLEASRRQNPRAEFREFERIVPRVAGDSARLGRVGPFPGGDVIGQALGAFGDGSLVKNIRSHGIHLAAAAAGPEFENRVKRVVEDAPFPGLDVLNEPVAVFHERSLVEPSTDIGDRGLGDFPGGPGRFQSPNRIRNSGRHQMHLTPRADQVGRSPTRSASLPRPILPTPLKVGVPELLKLARSEVIRKPSNPRERWNRDHDPNRIFRHNPLMD